MTDVSSAARALILAVRAYRWWLSPWLGSACRFEPTCSLYAIEAISRHGAARGSWLTGGRLLRCHPFCAGGCDPVPLLVTPSSPGDRLPPPAPRPFPPV